MGSTEEHGSHSPMGDYLATEEIALRVARETGDFVFPPLPFSYSEYFRHFPGTITLSTQLLHQFVWEVIECLRGSSFRHIVLFNGHKGNEPTLLHLVRDLRRDIHYRTLFESHYSVSWNDTGIRLPSLSRWSSRRNPN